MPLFLTDEQKALKETVKKFTDEQIIPVRAEIDNNEEYPEDILKMLICDMQLACPFIPTEYGGAGLGLFEASLIAEELARGCLGISTVFSVSGLGIYPVMLAGSHQQKQKYLTPVASGAKTASFALTEASAGSDVINLKTTAVKTRGGYVLNGVKQWITGASRSDIYSVFAYTDHSKGPRGLSCFVVEKGTEGLSFGAKEKKMGLRCSETREVILNNCIIPEENLIGREGHGFRYIMETLHHSRAVVAASAVGLSQGAYELAVKYTAERIQFNNPLNTLQSIQHILVDMATKIEAGRLLAYSAARMIDQRLPSHSKYSAMAKSFCGENAFWIAAEALQLMGGYGYMRDFPVEKMLRDARVLTIYEGTTQIQKNAIAKDIIRESKKHHL